MQAQRLDGVKFPITVTGLASICFQHEIDHLNGVNFIDYLSKDAKSFICRRLKREKTQKTIETS